MLSHFGFNSCGFYLQGILRSGAQLLLTPAKIFIPEEENTYGLKLFSSTFFLSLLYFGTKFLALDPLAINYFDFLYLKSSFSSCPFPPFLSVQL